MVVAIFFWIGPKTLPSGPNHYKGTILYDAVSFFLPLSSTGSAGACCHGACRLRWKRRLPRDPWGRNRALWHAQDLQYRPGQSVHVPSLHRVLKDNDIAISMDGRGSWRDNVFVERLWRSIKYEEVYLRAYDSVAEARASIGNYMNFYNTIRPHSSLDGKTPDQVYFNPPPHAAAA